MGIEESSPNMVLSRSPLKTGAIWCILVVLAAAPFFPLSNFVGHPHWDHARWIPFQDFSLSRNILKDVLGNTVWFMMFGCLLHHQLNGNSRSRWTLARIIIIASGISLSAELFQVFCHHRIASMTDVVCNVVGAGLGGYVAEKQPVTTSREPWLTRWLTAVFGRERCHQTSSVHKRELPFK